MDMGLSKLRQMDREAWHAEVHGVTQGWDTTEQLNRNSKKSVMM